MHTHLDGVTFLGSAGQATYSIEPDGLRGWHESVSVRREDVDRPTAHGTYRAQSYRTGRLIQQSGLIEAASRMEFLEAIDRFRGVLAGGGFGPFVVDDEGVRSAEVQLNAEPSVTMLVPPEAGRGGAARYSLELWAPDPRQYGEKRTFEGGTSVVPYHRGNFPAVPRVVVSSGFANGFRVVYGDRVFEVDRATFWQQEPLEIDMRTGWVWQGGSLLRGVIRRAETFEIPPHNQEPVRLVGSGSGSGRVSVELRDTWI